MNRQLKFRAFDKVNKKMLYGNHGLFMYVGCGVLGWNTGNDHEVLTDQSQYQLMQFLGLKDKDFNEVYEGDIIEDVLTKMRSVVTFGHCHKHAFTGWYVKNDEMGYASQINADYDTDQNNFIKVIGNIYQNSNILNHDPTN